MVYRKSGAVWLWVLLVSAVVAACGGGGGGGGAGNGAAGTPSYSVSGSVSGLTGIGLVLQNNGGDNLSANANGTFAFPKTLANGAAYKVTVLTQPALQTCTVNNGVGTINGANVSNVSVVCATTSFTVSGTVSGLTGIGLVLLDNGGNNLAINANGTFTFAAPLASGANYSVTVGTQPAGQTCTVNGGAGAVASANVSGVNVICSATAYTVGGTVTGLAGTGLVLQDNNGDNLSIAANGNFIFATQVANGANYKVTVFTQPTGPSQTCTVTGGTGTMAGANIATVAVNCTTNTYNVSGTVTGLAGTGLVLLDNGGDNLAVAANGQFTFATKVASGAPYTVTVGTQPGGPAQTCTVSAGTGVVTASNIANVSVVCSTNTYTVSGAITGLSGAGLVLLDNGGDNLAIAAGSGTFTFATNVASGSTYTVTVGTQPAGPTQTCTVTNFTGSVTNANIANVAVNCSTNTYTVSGTVTAYAGTGLVLSNNGGNFLTVTANGAFSFTTPVASGGAYNVAASSQPTSPAQTCTVSSGAGSVTNANIANVSVVCSINTYPVGGTVTGLTGTGLVLQNNGANNLSVAGNGAFGFTTQVASGAGYNVTILTQPAGQTCLAFNGAGVVAGSAITNVLVYCPTVSVPRYAYATNATGSVSYFVVDAATGRLKSVGRGATSGAQYIAVDPSGKYAYVVNSLGVNQYTIGTNGTLTPMVPALAAAGTTPVFVTVDPTGRYVYVANTGSSDVSVFTIGATGALTQTACAAACSGILPANFAAGTSPNSVTVDSTGQYAYVTNGVSGNVSQFTIGVNGALVPMATPAVAAGATPQSVTLDPSGHYAYVANSGSANVSQYNIGAGGGLIPMPAPTVPAGAGPVSVVVDPTLRYAYVANSTGNSVSQYTISAGGALVAMAPSSVPAGTGPKSVIADPSGKYVYVANSVSNDVSEFAIGAGGALAPIAPAAIFAQPGTSSLAMTHGATAVQAVPQSVYATQAFSGGSPTSNTLAQFTIGAGGSLAAMTPANVASTGTSPLFVAVDPLGSFVYSANCGSNAVEQYTIGAGGGLTAWSGYPMGTCPVGIAIHPSGRFIYMVNQSTGASNNLMGYEIVNNSLVNAVAALQSGLLATSVTIDPSGKYMYVTNQTGGDIAAYSIGSLGALTQIACAAPALCSISTIGNFSAGATPLFSAVDPSGRYLFVVNGSSSVSQFSIGANGSLTSVGGASTASGATTPQSVYVAVEPTGKYVYVANRSSGDIAAFVIGPTGVLTHISCGAVGTAGCSGTAVPTNFATSSTGVSTLPQSVTVDASGKYLYVANNAGGDIAVFSIGGFGMLTPVSCGAVGTVGCSGTAVPTNFAAPMTPYNIVTLGTWQ